MSGPIQLGPRRAFGMGEWRSFLGPLHPLSSPITDSLTPRVGDRVEVRNIILWNFPGDPVVKTP